MAAKKLSPKQQLLKSMVPKRKIIPYEKLRDYQKQCIDVIESIPPGSKPFLVVMATGLGKTATFTHLPDHGGKTMIITHGKELVLNPLQYYPADAPVGVEMGSDFHAKADFPDAQIICASIDSLHLRLDTYDPEEFYTIIIDEAHHSCAETYRKVIDYFRPQRLIGFTATPTRSDGQSLATIYDRIAFSRDIPWAIKNGYLSDIRLTKEKINYDLRNVRTTKKDTESVADFDPKELARAMAQCDEAIIDLYYKTCFGPTIINVAGIDLAMRIANSKRMPRAVAITSYMTDQAEREQALQSFRDGRIDVLVNVGVLNEGVDLPNVRSILMCRPTLSSILYTQMVGRGLRLFPGKDYLNLVEVEGMMGENVQLCSAPLLFGIDLSLIPKREQSKLENIRLTEMERVAKEIIEAPNNWSTTSSTALAWADTSGYDLCGVNWLRYPDGHFEVFFQKENNPEKRDEKTNALIREYYRMTIPAPDIWGRVVIGCTRMPLQVALELCREELDRHFKQYKPFWDTNEMNRWMLKKESPSSAQLTIIKRHIPDIDVSTLTKGQASIIVGKILAKNEETINIYPFDPETPPANYSKEEIVSIERQKFTIYDYEPSGNYVLDEDRKNLEDQIIQWLWWSNAKALRQEQGDLEAVVARINKKFDGRRVHLAKAFITKNTPKYKYLCHLNGMPISREELLKLLAQFIDELLPRIIQRQLNGQKYNPEQIRKTVPKMNEAPLNKLTLQFPKTEALLQRKTGSRGLGQTEAEIKLKAQEKHLEKKLRLEKKEKSKATTPQNTRKTTQPKTKRKKES